MRVSSNGLMFTREFRVNLSNDLNSKMRDILNTVTSYVKFFFEEEREATNGCRSHVL